MTTGRFDIDRDPKLRRSDVSCGDHATDPPQEIGTDVYDIASPNIRIGCSGWTDSLRALHPDETIYTFWDYFRNAYGRDAGLRIDHLLLSPSLADRLRDAQVDRQVRGWEKTSDHAPTWISLAAEPPAKKPRRPSQRKKDGK